MTMMTTLDPRTEMLPSVGLSRQQLDVLLETPHQQDLDEILNMLWRASKHVDTIRSLHDALSALVAEAGRRETVDHVSRLVGCWNEDPRKWNHLDYMANAMQRWLTKWDQAHKHYGAEPF